MRVNAGDIGTTWVQGRPSSEWTCLQQRWTTIAASKGTHGAAAQPTRTHARILGMMGTPWTELSASATSAAQARWWTRAYLRWTTRTRTKQTGPAATALRVAVTRSVRQEQCRPRRQHNCLPSSALTPALHNTDRGDRRRSKQQPGCSLPAW